MHNFLKNTTNLLTTVSQLLDEIHDKLGLVYDQLGDVSHDDSAFYHTRVRPVIKDLRQRIEMVLGDLSTISYDVEIMLRKCTDLAANS